MKIGFVSPLVYIVGPTAVGKTCLAIALAQKFDGEVINADSRQVYLGMDVGTAKPTPAERAAAPHHLLDLLEPSDHFGLGSFLALAKKALAEIRDRNNLAIVCGGAGQYIWGLVEGADPPQVPPDPAFREAMEQEAQALGDEAMHRRLQEIDPERAAALDPRNVRRVIRALEIFRATNHKPSEYQRQHPAVSDALVIGLTIDRKALYERIDARVDQMMEDGFLVEVKRLISDGYPAGEAALASPGYRELGQHLAGELSLDEAVARTKTQTHRLARRQYTWFKPSDRRITWLDAGAPDVVDEAAEAVSSFLSATGPVVQ